jgi:tetratricopeptide (TPR) repeat protein
MSLLGKLFGRRSLEEERAHADDLFAKGELGLAKLSYERALELASSGSAELRAELTQRVAACRDGLGRARIAEAKRLLEEGAQELAAGELEAAIEIGPSAELQAEAERLLEGLERKQAREHATTHEQSDEERFETISGSWEDAQYEEYAAKGPELRSALLALYDGQSAPARAALEKLVEAAPDARYLYFELGRARLLEGETEGGRAALERFLKSLAPEEGGESRLVAHMELAALHSARGDIDAAAAEHEAAVEALPEDPRPYLALANFLRREGMASEAVEVLTSASTAFDGEGQRPFRLTLELGLAHADLGEDERAIEALEEVVSYLTARQLLDLPPECAVPLARLHEKRGNKARALDLYNLLSSGSDTDHHAEYYEQAARLLLELDRRADARRMLQRARELVTEPEARAALERKLEELK